MGFCHTLGLLIVCEATISEMEKFEKRIYKAVRKWLGVPLVPMETRRKLDDQQQLLKQSKGNE